jgi:protein-S-isoprenylcysteine O-methyltransferase Ste14
MRLVGVDWKVFIIIAVWLTIAWLMGYLRPLDVSLGSELPEWVQVPGAVAVLIGGIGVLGCGAMLSTLGIGTLPGREKLLPQEFLATGPFRFTRNPMSLAGVILLAGIALWYQSALGLAAAGVLFVLFHLLVVFVEEPGLEVRFGDSYRAYKRQVPRWLPRWRAWSAPPDGGGQAPQPTADLPEKA